MTTRNEIERYVLGCILHDESVMAAAVGESYLSKA